jgi:hypothetical protein
MTDKLHISYELERFDRKDRNFFDDLSEDEQKKFSPYMMIRWGASILGSYDLQAYQLLSLNERLNKNFFDVNTTKHKKFQWLLATTVSPDMGKQYYKWLPASKKETKSKLEKLIAELYPQFDDEEIELIALTNTKQELKELAKSHGWDDKKIKEYL